MYSLVRAFSRMGTRGKVGWITVAFLTLAVLRFLFGSGVLVR